MTNTASTNDTIAAIATASGRGGIGIIRVSGPNVPNIIKKFLNQTLMPRHATLCAFKDAKGETLDSGIALYFKVPNSYTGEDVLELQGHGGPVVLNLILKDILNLGVRLAKPGEFTERAYLNEKLDLAQAEAVIDLIESSSEQAARAAAKSLDGAFSNTMHALLKSLIQLRMYIEAALDFPEEEIDFLSDAEVQQRMQSLKEDLQTVAGTLKQGRLLKDGITVVILGQPNAGKSSLLNKLAGKESAIVTDIAGTTRDVLREHIHIEGLPLHIIDTAGLRESGDAIEQEGVKRAWSEVGQADRVLLLVDSQVGLNEKEQNILNKIPQHLPVDVIYNKLDLNDRLPYIKQTDVETESGVRTTNEIGLSAKTGGGLDLLIKHLKNSIGFQQTNENQFSARQRHVDAFHQVTEHVEQSHQQLNNGAGELAAEELRLAQDALSSITGEFSSDDLLGEIFSSFCIGK